MKKFRDPVSGLTHLGAAVAALIGLIGMLISARGQSGKEIALVIYGVSLVLMFSASAVYHLVQASPKTLAVLRKIDHSAIYLLIAGTYTPICLTFFSGFFRWGLLAIIWTLALSGIAVKIFILKAPRWVTAGIYLGMGWLSVIAAGEIWTRMPAAAITWLVAGGLLYSIGAVIYARKKPDPLPAVFGFHEIWHIFVILGALSHFIVVAGFV